MSVAPAYRWPLVSVPLAYWWPLVSVQLCHDLARTTPAGVFDRTDAINSAESFVEISRRPNAKAMLFDRL